MKTCKSTLITIVLFSFIFYMSCNNDDNGEKLTGQIGVTTVTTGTIDAGHKYLITFSGLVGDLEYADGIEIGANDNILIIMPRVGEQLTLYLSNIPTNCPDVTSTSATSNQIAFGGIPGDPKHPEAQYQSIYLVPVDGSVGELTFTIACN